MYSVKPKEFQLPDDIASDRSGSRGFGTGKARTSSAAQPQQDARRPGSASSQNTPRGASSTQNTPRGVPPVATRSAKASSPDSSPAPSPRLSDASASARASVSRGSAQQNQLLDKYKDVDVKARSRPSESSYVSARTAAADPRGSSVSFDESRAAAHANGSVPSSKSAPPRAAASSAASAAGRSAVPSKAADAGPKSRLDEILAECERAKKPWTDPDFPPTDKSLYFDPAKPVTHWKVTEWKRVSEICPNPQMFVGGVEAGDVIQGALGDCWFLGALSVVATFEELLLKCIPQRTINKWGVYEFRFYKNGEWVSVLVDDHIPTSKGRFVFCRAKDVNEAWVPLMEKAYAKLHKCYENLEGGSENYALVDMTGGAPQQYELDKAEGKTLVETGHLWDKLLKYHRLGYMLGCAFLASGGAIEANTGQGILQNHAYGLLDLLEVQGSKLLRVRNPWGQGEWTGKWSDSSKEWTPELLKLMNHTLGNDGAFWMEFGDFVKQYNRVYVLRLFDASWKHSFVKGQWKSESAGGCGNFPTWKNNPQYGFRMEDADEVFITLMQRDVKMDGAVSSKINVGFLVLKLDSLTKRIEKIVGSAVLAQTPFSNAREVSKKLKLTPGLYAIVPSTFNPKEETSFYLRVYSHGQGALHLTEIGAAQQSVASAAAAPKEKEQPGALGFAAQFKATMTSVFDDFARSGNEASDAEPADDPPVSPPAKRKGATPAAPGPVGNGKASASAKHRSDADTITRELRPHTAPVKPASSALVKGGADRPPESKALQPSETRKPASRALADTKRASKPPVFRSVGFLAAPEFQYIITQPVHGRKARASSLPDEVQQEVDELKIKAQALRQSGNVRDEALHYFRLASVFFQHGHFEQSIVFAEKFRAIVTAGGDIIATALALNYLGANYFYLGQTTSYADQGIEHVRQAVDFHRRQHELTPDLVSRYVANCNLGVCFLALNESLGATTHYKQALEASTQLNDPEAQSIVYDLLAANSEKAKDYGSAKQFLDKRLRVAEALKDRQTVAEVHKRLGSLLLSWRGTFEEDARRHFDIASQFETAQADPFDDEELMSHADDLALEDGPAAANGHDSEYDDAGSFASDVDLDDSRERAYDTGPESGGEPGPEYQSDSDFSVFGNYESKLDRNRSLKAKAATSGTTFDSRKATSSRPVVKKKQDSGSLSDTEFKSRKKSFD